MLGLYSRSSTGNLAAISISWSSVHCMCIYVCASVCRYVGCRLQDGGLVHPSLPLLLCPFRVFRFSGFGFRFFRCLTFSGNSICLLPFRSTWARSLDVASSPFLPIFFMRPQRTAMQKSAARCFCLGSVCAYVVNCFPRLKTTVTAVSNAASVASYVHMLFSYGLLPG